MMSRGTWPRATNIRLFNIGSRHVSTLPIGAMSSTSNMQRRNPLRTLRSFIGADTADLSPDRTPNPNRESDQNNVAPRDEPR